MKRVRFGKLDPPGIVLPAILLAALIFAGCSRTFFSDSADNADSPRVRFSINEDWRFIKGDPPDMTAFPSLQRKAFNGLALAIIRAKRGQEGEILVIAKSDGLLKAQTTINAAEPSAIRR